ncbi:hypothetical protein HOA92_06785 [archaeon]|jgi:hypothetical protein|nr:hypothetical protein [archaeon]MBT6762718.1 hypothetical protein [archaeon]
MGCNKRAQVTVFIILGVVILSSATLFFYLSSGLSAIETGADLGLESNQDAVQLFVEKCLADTSYDALSQVLANGGYYHIDEELIDYANFLEFSHSDDSGDNSNYPYYFFNGVNSQPDIEDIAKQVELAVVELFSICVDDFSAFDDQGLIFEQSEPIVNVKFVSGGYTVDLDYYFVLNSESLSEEYSHFEVFIGFDFLNKYEQLELFLEGQEEDPEYFSIGKLSSMFVSNSDYFDFEPVGEAGSDLLLNLYYYQENEDDIVYTFGLSYDWDDLGSFNSQLDDAEVPELNESLYVSLTFESEWNINEVGVYTLDVESNAEEFGDVVYSINPSSLDIDQDSGLITFDTNDYTNGVYSYFIMANNSNNVSVEGALVINLNANNGNLPMIEEFSNSSFSIGDNISFAVSVSNEDPVNYFYAAATSVFEIDKQSGEFSFIATEDLVGKSQVYFTVENDFGLSWYLWNFEVQE